eukprot:CAMPEP_0198544740 /NCGR_PEP_ID=MMETSP1462-20131121/61772_1 /TAXON_ID=1333877 /ORGANISM="Brandtodinium nutriculum, Strain RCC3387" /LENGTH=248 /DNA_ID=CAMNT_0044275083 /DNA_START=84 /DNA_END=827 /DNA_ORIENTATION=+
MAMDQVPLHNLLGISLDTTDLQSVLEKLINRANEQDAVIKQLQDELLQLKTGVDTRLETMQASLDRVTVQANRVQASWEQRSKAFSSKFDAISAKFKQVKQRMDEDLFFQVRDFVTNDLVSKLYNLVSNALRDCPAALADRADSDGSEESETDDSSVDNEAQQMEFHLRRSGGFSEDWAIGLMQALEERADRYNSFRVLASQRVRGTIQVRVRVYKGWTHKAKGDVERVLKATRASEMGSRAQFEFVW